MSFCVWVTGPDRSRVEAVADAIARRLAGRVPGVEALDLRTPGIDAIAAEDAPAFVAVLLARHGVATVVALPVPTRAARERARAAHGRMIEVYVPAGGTQSPPYEPPERAEVEINDAADVDRVVHTLEVLDFLPRGQGRGYTEEEERAVIRRLKAFGYL